MGCKLNINIMKKKNIILLVCIAVLSLFSVDAQNVYYVTAEADGSKDGSSWSDATDLQSAIAKTTGNDQVDIILVKKGLYVAPSKYGTTYDGLGFYFENKNNVTVYGNCDGDEDPDHLPQIDETTNIETYLTAPEDNGNVLGRIISVYKGFVTIIGFDISGGDASQSSTGRGGNNGGAVWISGGGVLKYCNIHNSQAGNGGGAYITINGDYKPAVLDHCRIYENISAGTSNTSGGAGVYAGSGAEVKNCIIENNESLKRGGGISGAGVNIVNCLLRDNKAATGGAIYNDGSSVINCLVVKNAANSGAGAISCNGASALIVNSTIVNNQVTGNNNSDAGGISLGTGTLKNSIVWDNYKNEGKTKMDLRLTAGSAEDAVSKIFNSCYETSSANMGTFSPVLTDNLTGADNSPLFVNIDEGDYNLKMDSPCIDAGNNLYYLPDFPEFDLAGNNRVENKIIDMGAFEYRPTITDIDENKMSDNVYVSGNKLVINVNSGVVKVYGITSGIRYVDKIVTGADEISLPAGIYVVSIDGKSKKVIIK